MSYEGTVDQVDHLLRRFVIESEHEIFNADFGRVIAPNAHGCLVQPGDKVKFSVRTGNRPSNIRFKHDISYQSRDREVSVVGKRSAQAVFLARQTANCGCSIMVDNNDPLFHKLNIGDVVEHGFKQLPSGIYLATNLQLITETF